MVGLTILNENAVSLYPTPCRENAISRAGNRARVTGCPPPIPRNLLDGTLADVRDRKRNLPAGRYILRFALWSPSVPRTGRRLEIVERSDEHLRDGPRRSPENTIRVPSDVIARG